MPRCVSNSNSGDRTSPPAPGPIVLAANLLGRHSDDGPYGPFRVGEKSAVGPFRSRCDLSHIWTLLLAVQFGAGLAAVQQVLTETESKDTPAQANRFQGEAILAGSMSGQDQDAFAWTVFAADAGFYWNLELQGLPETITKVDVIQVEFADNGTDVKSRKILFSLSAAGAHVSTASGGMIFTPGAYILGLSKASGEGDYRFAVRRGEALPARMEKEPNDQLDQANDISIDRGVRGRIASAGETDLFRSDISSLPDRVYFPAQIEIFEQQPGPDYRCGSRRGSGCLVGLESPMPRSRIPVQAGTSR